ncbi:MAG: aromatic ring-hydroxylating dioxygenase subunit alpha [Chromatiales bacterium]|jgi:phenylpropionate dioxygenase-like ring-hydroxylating dioxygenase large terminal subunit|nr:aromatic ring-hydroxylating dioxygenase subunit alpha [Chromatiales bacterium]
MFDLCPRQWTPALPLTELRPGLTAFEAAGERLVAFREPGGPYRVLLDRCPHRQAALSLGELTPEGHVQCRYHGWRFDGAGACQRVPLNDLTPAALARIRVPSVPARALAGALWIYTATDVADPPDPQLPASLEGDPERFGTYSQHWRAHWTRAVENFIDFAHPSYLHRDTIGAYTHHYAEGGAVATCEVEATPWGFRTLNYFGSRRQGFRVDWYRPNLSVLHFGAGNEGKLHVFSIPLNATQTRVMTVRRLPPGYDAAAWTAQRAAVDNTILDEDRFIVESQPGAVNEDEISVATDAPCVTFRRWWRELLRDQPSATPAAPA